MPAKRKRRRSQASGGRPEIVKQQAVPQVVASGPDLAEAPTEGFHQRTKINVTIALILAAATFAVYFRAITNPFVNYDDQGYVVENKQVQQGLTRAMFRWALTSTDATNWHPVTWISHALDCQLFRLNPAGHHLTSVMLHLFNSILLFLLLARATGATARSLLVAALFALHPINVESVAWIAERKNVLCMFFMLLTIGAYGWYARQPKISRYLAVVALFVLALAAKPMAVTLPFALILLDFWPLKRVASLQEQSEAFPVPQARFWRLALEKLPLLFLSIGSSLVTLVAQKAAVATNEHVPMLVRLVNASYAYAMYVAKVFWPAGLTSFYPYEGYRLATWKLCLCILFLIAATVWIWRQRAHEFLPVGWFWFLGTLVPMIGLVQVGDQAMADRYAYLPLIGIFVIVVWGATELAERLRLDARLCLGGAAAVLSLFSFLTWRQIGIWHSSRDLWTHALQVTKDNYMAEDYVGSALLLEHYEATGQRRYDDALVHFRNAVRINPNDAIAHLNLGADMQEHGQLREAMEQYQMVLSLTEDPHLVAKSLIDLGAASQQLKNYAAAEQYYNDAQKLEPSNSVLSSDIGSNLMDIGQEAMFESVRKLAVSAAAHPTPAAYLQLGQLQQAAGMIPDAHQSYENALKLDPKLIAARKALSSLTQNAN